MTGAKPLPTSLDTSTEKCTHSPCVPLYRVFTHRTCGAKLIVPVRCKSRFCFRCARLRSRELVAKYLPVLAVMKNRKFLTLTLKDVPRGKLNAARREIVRCLGKLRRRKLFQGVRAGVWALDVTFDGDWHVHVHVIIDGPYIRQADLSREWAQITAGSPVVWIEKCRGLVKASKELLKYVAKFWKIDDHLAMQELKVAFKGKKQVDCWGAARSGCISGVGSESGGVVCPRCGESFNRLTWYVEEVSLEELLDLKHFGPLWADFYWLGQQARAG